MQAGRKVPSRWRNVSGVTHPGGVALAMLANLQERGGYRGRVAEALLTRYDLPEQAAGSSGSSPRQAASSSGRDDLLVDERGLSAQSAARPAGWARGLSSRHELPAVTAV